MPDQVETEEKREVPVDKKRIALVNGSCGQADRIEIAGQVVDIPVTEMHIKEEWDQMHPLPRSQKVTIRPIQDFGMTGVRRPRLQVEILRGRLKNATEEELNEAEIVHSSPVFNGDDNSFFSIRIKEKIEPGDYTVRIILRGVDSLRQSVADLSFIGNSNSLILKKDIPIGYGNLRVLPDDYRGLIITSDIDQTYLDTQIGSSQGLLDTLFETPDSKLPLPGMPEFYRQIKKYSGGVPLIFISASPHFFRRTLKSVLEYHDIEFNALNLKYLMSTIDTMVRKTLQTVTHFPDFLSSGVSQAVERSFKFLGSSIQSLYDQIAYKLTTLLENRLMQPTGAREILLGDNTESDFFIFTLYQYIITGKLESGKLENYLYHLVFQDREALTRDAARRIAELGKENIDRHGRINSVHRVWINQAFQNPDEDEMRRQVGEALPEGVSLNFAAADGIVPFNACKGGIGFSLAALDDELVDLAQFRKIWEYIRNQPDDRRPTENELIQTVRKSPLRRFTAEEILDSTLTGSAEEH